MQNDVVNFVSHRFNGEALGDSLAGNCAGLGLHIFKWQINCNRTFALPALEFLQPIVQMVHQKRTPRTADSHTCDDRNSKFGFKESNVNIEAISCCHVHHVKDKNDRQAVVFGLQNIMQMCRDMACVDNKYDTVGLTLTVYVPANSINSNSLI